jgi:hypothetical protein
MTAYADAIAKPPRTLTELEQKLILKTTGEHRDGDRDHVLISLALGTGPRAHEFLVRVFALSDGAPLTLSEGSARGGKGGHQRGRLGRSPAAAILS